jgi:hypothetical protein
MDRYWIRENKAEWEEVDKARFVAAERRAGFRNKMGQPDEPATGGFSSVYRPGQADEHSLEGTVRDPALRTF